MEHLLGIIRAFDGTQVTILENGRSGRVVIQVEGRDIGLDIADEVVHTCDRRLVFIDRASSNRMRLFVKIESFVTNNTDETQDLIVADVPMWATTARFWRGPPAPNPAKPICSTACAGWADTQAAHAAVLRPGDDIGGAPLEHILDDEVLPLFQGKLKVEPGETRKFGRYLVVDEGGSQVAEADGGRGRPRGLRHADRLDRPVRRRHRRRPADRRAQLSRPGDLNYHGVIRPASDGSFTATLPADDYELTVVGATRNSAAPVAATVTDGGTANVDLPLDSLAYVHYAVTDESDDPVPCKLTSQPGFNAHAGAGVAYRIFSINGSGAPCRRAITRSPSLAATSTRSTCTTARSRRETPHRSGRLDRTRRGFHRLDDR